MSADQICGSGERRADLKGSDETREMATARQELIALIDMPISKLVTSTNAQDDGYHVLLINETNKGFIY